MTARDRLALAGFVLMQLAALAICLVLLPFAWVRQWLVEFAGRE